MRWQDKMRTIVQEHMRKIGCDEHLSAELRAQAVEVGSLVKENWTAALTLALAAERCAGSERGGDGPAGGDEGEALLKVVEEAASIRDEARAGAETIRLVAGEDADRILVEARAEAKRIVEEAAEEDGHELLKSTSTKAEIIRRQGVQDAQDALDHARVEADRISRAAVGAAEITRAAADAVRANARDESGAIVAQARETAEAILAEAKARREAAETPTSDAAPGDVLQAHKGAPGSGDGECQI